MGLAKRTSTLVNIVTMLLLTVLRRALGLVSISVLARLLSSAEIGAYAFAQSTGQTFVGLLRLGALQGLHIMISKRVGDGEPKADLGRLIGGGIVLCSTIAILGGLLITLLADPIAGLIFGAPELAPYVKAAALFFAGQFLSQGAYVGFAGLGKFVDYTFYATVIGIATMAITVAGAVIYGVTGAVWGFAGATLAGAPVYFLGLVRALRGLPVRIELRPKWAHMREIFGIGFPFYAAGVFVIPAEYLSQGLVSRAGGLGDLGDLRIILTLMSVVMMIPQAISGPIITLFSEREGRETGAGSASALEHMRWLWIFALVSGAALAVIWPLAIMILFGNGFPQAAAMGQIAIMAFVPTIIGTALSAGILVGGKTRALVLVGIAQAIMMIALAYPLIALLGLTGYFIAKTGAVLLAAILWLVIIGLQSGERPTRGWMGPLILGTVILYAMLGLDAVFDEPLFLRLGLGIALCGGLAALALYGAISAPERALLLAQAQEAKQKGLSRIAALRGPGKAP
ncbi:MAG: oligosaccharide flippase family protein [Pseudomonadota bacterium]